MKKFVLDSYAVLALLNNEPGAERIERLFEQAEEREIELAISLINLGEVAYIVERRWGKEPLRAMLAYLEASPLHIAEVSREQVFQAAHSKAEFPLAYADAFAVALALDNEAVLVTGDPEFNPLADRVAIEWLAGP